MDYIMAHFSKENYVIGIKDLQRVNTYSCCCLRISWIFFIVVQYITQYWETLKELWIKQNRDWDWIIL